MEAEDAYRSALHLFESVDQQANCLELLAELALLASRRGDRELAMHYVDRIIPDRNSSALQEIQQPSICWCCYEVLKMDEPSAAFVLLENGTSTLQAVAEQITDAGAHRHYVSQLPHHAELMEAWKSRAKHKSNRRR
jgi:hypothetical protein